MIYSGTRCKVLTAGKEKDTWGNDAYFGRCLCGWESSIYSGYPVDAEIDTELHIAHKRGSS